MPFTVSHVAAVLPLRRTGLPAAPLAIGAMAPDLVFFVPFGPSRAVSHSLIGAVTLDPVISLVALLLWWVVLRPPVLDLAPRGIRERMTTRPVLPRRAVRAVLTVIVAILVGIATHLAWDCFTHRDALAAIWPPWRVRLGPLLLTSWLQYASSVGGAIVLVVWARWWWVRTPSDPTRPRITPEWTTRAALGGVAATMVIVGLSVVAAQVGSGIPDGLSSLVFRAVVYPISAGILAVLVIAAIWWVRRGVSSQTASRIRS